MKWEATSTNSPEEIAREFAARAFDPPRQLDADGVKIDKGGDGRGPVRGLFRLAGDRRMYEIEGTPPGRWVITSKYLAVAAVATKEECHAAREELADIWTAALSAAKLPADERAELGGRLARVAAFLDAVERRLPTADAVKADKDRKRVKVKTGGVPPRGSSPGEFGGPETFR
jgi:hypothetical protein